MNKSETLQEMTTRHVEECHAALVQCHAIATREALKPEPGCSDCSSYDDEMVIPAVCRYHSAERRRKLEGK